MRIYIQYIHVYLRKISYVVQPAIRSDVVENCRGRATPRLLPFSPGLHLGSYAVTHQQPNMSAPDKPPAGDALDLPPHALRDVLRVCLSAKEYRFLHESVIKRAPAVQNKLPSPSRYDAIARPKNRHSEAAIRSSLRVFVGSGIALKLADLLVTRFQGAPQ